MSNKVVYVKANFKPLYGKSGVLKAIFGSKQSASLLNPPDGLEHKGWSDSEIDGERFAKDISEAIETLNKEGYEVSIITNITSGAYHSDYSEAEKSSYGLGYGYSYTEGAILVGKRQ
jgi:hypothetical protein